MSACEVDLAVAHSHRFRCDLVFVSYLKIAEVLQRTPNRYECSCSQLTFDLFLQMLMSAGRTMWSVLISVIITSEDTAAAVNRVTTSLMINTNAVVRTHTHTPNSLSHLGYKRFLRAYKENSSA